MGGNRHHDAVTPPPRQLSASHVPRSMRTLEIWDKRVAVKLIVEVLDEDVRIKVKPYNIYKHDVTVEKRVFLLFLHEVLRELEK